MDFIGNFTNITILSFRNKKPSNINDMKKAATLFYYLLKKEQYMQKQLTVKFFLSVSMASINNETLPNGIDGFWILDGFIKERAPEP